MGPEVIVGGRAFGKTKRCIELASEKWAYIVCPSHKDARRIADMARDMEKDIPFPITLQELVSGQFHRTNIKGFVVDDVDRMLALLARGVPILGVSLNREEPDDSGADA